MSIVARLTENIVNRDLGKEGAALLNKWEKTGLLEGLGNDVQKNGMARLLENQAKELLREASTMSGGDVEGFAAVAFPIVRRVFGSLIANEVVSVQPMALPSGLIFFLDFTYTQNNEANSLSDVATADQSIYGGSQVGKGIAEGVDISTDAETSFYALNNGYSSVTASMDIDVTEMSDTNLDGDKTVAQIRAALEAGSITAEPDRSVALKTVYDPDLTDNDFLKIVTIKVSDLEDNAVDLNNLVTMQVLSGSKAGGHVAIGTDGLLSADAAAGPAGTQHRRLSQLIRATLPTSDQTTSTPVSCSMAFTLANSAGAFSVTGADEQVTLVAARRDSWQAGGAVPGSVLADLLGLEGAGLAGNIEYETGAALTMKEIDIKVDSLPVVAQTKKLKAKWSPELGQDLNAYHNLDAEVELTSILSEQVALEIDREILEDLVKGSTAATLHWSRHAGKFLNRETGKEVGATTAAPDFTGTVSEWYETLAETINDVSAAIHRKTLRGGANFIVCGPEVANVLEFTAGFRASVTGDADRGSVGAVKVGSISKKWDVYVDPYFPRQLVLVGRKGSSFLESGYVYAPYVPLQVTPTIFGVEDFVPRKGVMTRYAKKMVRPDMYGLVVVHDLIG
jgi:hypothetical protein